MHLPNFQKIFKAFYITFSCKNRHNLAKKRLRIRKIKDQGLQSLRAPEPDEVVPSRGRAPEAGRRAHVERVTVPPAAAQDGLISRRRPLWIPRRAASIVVLIKPIGCPFPHITGHTIPTLT